MGRQLPLFEPATEWRTLDERSRGTTFIAIRPRSVLNSPETTRMGYWSLNPYVGCEFGCTYCFARDAHRYASECERERGEPAPDMPAWLAFERRILVKQGAAARLARTISPERLAGNTIVIGTATDPYQPAERRFRITRDLLEALAQHRGLSIDITTKSPLVTRDIDVLRTLRERGRVRVNISIATLDARLARRLEMRSPVPAVRLRTLRRLHEAGIPTAVFIAPVLPGITDDRASLERIFAAARAAGAEYIMGSPLRLRRAARERFFPHLDREFPHLAARYRRAYARSVAAPDAYRTALAERINALRREYGFTPHDEDADDADDVASE